VKLASRFSYRSPVLRSDHPLSMIRSPRAQSIFAETPPKAVPAATSYIRPRPC